MSEKKSAQNALSRLISLREQTMYYVEGKKPELIFGNLEDQIVEKMKKIEDLKLRIIYTNCISFLENGMILQEAIIKLGDTRSELKSYNDLLRKDPEGRSLFHLSSPKAKDYISQISKKEIMEKIEEMEGRKYELDALIAKANNTIDVVDRLPR
ncbi:MAG: hypothetical protein ACMUHU_00045 [Thermoplasmatota archaeon]